MIGRVLVTDGETAAALAVVRSLVRAGHRVGVLASSRHAPAASSRGVRAVRRAPPARSSPDGWTAAVLRTLCREGWDLVLPVTDEAMLLLDRVRGEIPARTILALPPPGTLGRLLDKVEVLEAAERVGVPVLPRRSPDELAGAPLPAVVKPRRSRLLAFREVRAAAPRVVGDVETLRREVDRFVRRGHGAYVEPWIPGRGRGIFLLLDGGRMRARFAHERLREASPLGGPSAVALSVPADPDLLRHAEALAEELEVTGPFMAEFRGQGAEGTVLLEVNLRYWGSLALAVDAGVDFPALHAAALLGGTREDPAGWFGGARDGPAGWRIGLRRRNLALDLRGTLTALRGRPRGLPLPWPGRLRALGELLFSRAGGMFARRADPAPGRSRALEVLGKVVGRG